MAQAFTERTFRARMAIAFLSIAFSGPGVSEAQTGRESLVNPGQSGPQGIVGGPPGPSVGRTQPSLGGLPSVEFGPADPNRLPLPRTRAERNLPLPIVPDQLRPPGIPRPRPDIGQPGGITLDMAIDLLVHNSLELQGSRGDIAQAAADSLTASLRTNPVAFVDTQGVPYGSYHPNSAGGPNQYDFNVVHPLDLSHKRQTRMRSAWLNQEAVEAKYRDVVRLAIDNLYTAFVDALLAQRNLDYQQQKERGEKIDIFSLVSVDNAQEVLEDALRTLAVQFKYPFEELRQRGVFGRLVFQKGEEPVLPPEDDLVRMALAIRPDLITQRITVGRADADVLTARAARFDDVLLMYQPYTFYNGQGFDLKNKLAWSIGVTVPLPVYNRQQGNIEKARAIACQARTQLAFLEKVVEADVRRAVRQYNLTRKAIDEARFKAPIDIALRNLKDRFARPEAPDEDMHDLIVRLEELIKQDDEAKLTKFDEVIIQHRRSMLKLNTAVGQRLMP
jgi:cobalt-zinc-cadmium efflux system outer membrane protein